MIAPACDYISIDTVVTVKCPDCGASDCETATGMAERIRDEYVERARLEREIVAEAKIFNEKIRRIRAYTYTEHEKLQQYGEAINAMIRPLDALEQFEAKQK